eukprot:6176647-Pleurochrysis_carterae.AAC.1
MPWRYLPAWIRTLRTQAESPKLSGWTRGRTSPSNGTEVTQSELRVSYKAASARPTKSDDHIIRGAACSHFLHAKPKAAMLAYFSLHTALAAGAHLSLAERCPAR